MMHGAYNVKFINFNVALYGLPETERFRKLKTTIVYFAMCLGTIV